MYTAALALSLLGGIVSDDQLYVTEPPVFTSGVHATATAGGQCLDPLGCNVTATAAIPAGYAVTVAVQVGGYADGVWTGACPGDTVGACPMVPDPNTGQRWIMTAPVTAPAMGGVRTDIWLPASASIEAITFIALAP